MNKPNLPTTSLEAHDRVTAKMLSDHYKSILTALKVIKQGTYEQIAEAVAMEKHQIGRRLKELEGMELVYKPGIKLPTSTGRNAYVYRLCGEEKETTTEKILPGKSIVDFSKELVPEKPKTITVIKVSMPAEQLKLL